MKKLRILLIVIALIGIGIAVSYPIKYQRELQETESELEELSTMRRQAIEKAISEDNYHTDPGKVLMVDDEPQPYSDEPVVSGDGADTTEDGREDARSDGPSETGMPVMEAQTADESEAHRAEDGQPAEHPETSEPERPGDFPEAPVEQPLETPGAPAEAGVDQATAIPEMALEAGTGEAVPPEETSVQPESQQPAQTVEAPIVTEPEQPAETVEAPGEIEPEQPAETAEAPGETEPEQPKETVEAQIETEPEQPTQTEEAPGENEPQQPAETEGASAGEPTAPPGEQPAEATDAPYGEPGEPDVQPSPTPTTSDGVIVAVPTPIVITPQPSRTPEPTKDIMELIIFDPDITTPTPTPTHTPTPTPTPTPSPTPDWTIRTGPDPYTMKEKIRLEKSKILPELQDIYALNQDLVGWIYIEDTNIDYPVVQSDDSLFYLKHDFYGKENANGQIILDPKCDPYTPSYNLVISGHHMNSGAMFGKLPLFKDAKYWDNHKIIEFDTLMARKRYVIFAVFYSADYDKDEEGFRYNADIRYRIDTEDWLKEIEDNQIYDTGIEVEYGDEFITLTTCERSRHRNGRFVVVARRIREGENFK